jgi:signal peptidase I
MEDAIEGTEKGAKRGVWARIGICCLNVPQQGLGLIRLGQYRAGIAILLLSLFLLPGALYLCAFLPNPSLGIFLATIACAFAGLVLCLIVSIVLSWQHSARKAARLGIFWRWYCVLGVWIVFACSSLALRQNSVDTHFRNLVVAAGNMQPALKVGDRLVAKMSNYGQISRGDVVIFVRDETGKDQPLSVFRVAALPGDTVSIQGGKLLINEAPVSLKPMGNFEIIEDGNSVTAKRFLEQFSGEEEAHEIVDLDPNSFKDVAKMKLAADQYFVLGDNRDDANDSRFDKSIGGPGIINQSQIKGRLLFHYWRTGVGFKEGRL